jgi:hypothetical protein
MQNHIAKRNESQGADTRLVRFARDITFAGRSAHGQAWHALCSMLTIIFGMNKFVTTRKYTFIRRQTNSAKDARYVSTDALIAARFAAGGDPGVEFEALNEFEDPTFAIDVVFLDDAFSRVFDRRIRMACQELGLIVPA